MANTKKGAPKKTANKKEASHAKKIETGQPEMKTEPEENTDFEPDSNEEQPQQEITNDEPSVADILKKNKVN